LAFLSLQVPWVECASGCHDWIHPNVGIGDCHSQSCDLDEHHESQGEAAHTAVLVAKAGPLPLVVKTPGPSYCSDIGTFAQATSDSHRMDAVSVAKVALEPAVRVSAVLLL